MLMNGRWCSVDTFVTFFACGYGAAKSLAHHNFIVRKVSNNIFNNTQLMQQQFVALQRAHLQQFMFSFGMPHG